jgi:hypothetical protein
MKEKFIQLCRENIKRDGIDDLMNWLEKSDFYKAPSSTRFHGNYEGGLVEHSVNVYNRLLQLMPLTEAVVSPETIAIISLFHDLCKVNTYKVSSRNVKEDNVWVQKPFYEFEEKFPFGGHGSKSVFIIQQFMKLTPEEAVCVNCHMSCFNTAPNDYSVSDAFKKYTLALLVSFADQLASFVDEKTV